MDNSIGFLHDAICSSYVYKNSEHRPIKDWLVDKMYFHRIFASAITSHGFTIIFNFIITTAVAYVPKMGDPVPACPITGNAHPLPFQWQTLQ